MKKKRTKHWVRSDYKKKKLLWIVEQKIIGLIVPSEKWKNEV